MIQKGKERAMNVWLNGELVPMAEARVSAMDAGLLLGAGLFETLRAYEGFVFRAADHVARLLRSAGALDIEVRESRDELIAALDEVIKANDLGDARCRITVTRGALGADTDAPARSTCLVTAGAMTPYPPELYEKGMTVTVSDARINQTDPTCGHKTTNYLSNLLILRDAHARGAQESLRFNGPGRLVEGCIANVFVVKDGQLITPPLDEGCLPGITRAVVLDLAREAGIDVAEAPIEAKDVLAVSEMFVTNAIMEVMPVCRVEREPIGDDKPGEVTRRLMQLYKDCVESERADA